jgi:N12 class adenine-specific DNA methylase/tRNA1(Val) A37 N6-methylase TrmN6
MPNPTLAQLRQQHPELEGLNDADAVSALQQAFYPEVSEAALAQHLGVSLDTPVQGGGSSFLRRAVGDTAISALKGAIAIPEAAVGLMDLATGGGVGRGLEQEAGFRPKEAREFLDQYLSPEQKAANARVQGAQGVLGTVAEVVRNPSVIYHSAVESLPSMFAGGIAGGALARGAAAASARVAAARSLPVVGGALGEGLTTAGQQAESIRQETTDGFLTGEQAALAAGSGALTGALGLLAGKVAQRFGIADIDTILAGKGSPEITKGLVRRVLEGAASEGLLEELPQSIQEQVAQNLALGKPLDEGVAQAGVLGALTGAAMGAGGNLVGHKTPAGAIRDQKVEPVGPASRAVNNGLEVQAKAVEVAEGAQADAAEAAAAAAVVPAETPAAVETAVENSAAPYGGDAGASIRDPEAGIGAMHEAASAEARRRDFRPGPALPPAAPAVINAQGLPEDQVPARLAAAAAAEQRQAAVDPVDILQATRDLDTRDRQTAAMYREVTRPDGQPFLNRRAAATVAKREGGEVVETGRDAFVVRVPQQQLAPELDTQVADGPTHGAGERWTHDRGAMPGEPFAYLDGDADTAKAAMREVEVPGKGRYYEVTDTEGNTLSSGTTPREAGELAERALTPAADAAVHDTAATSPHNDLPEPTEAQKKAGNYAVGRMKLGGLDLSIENPKGSVRKGVDRDGKAWENTLHDHYGYIRRSEGADGDHVDAFVKEGTPEDWNGTAFVVDQVHPDTGKFDEHKVMLGYDSMEEAKAAYARNYAKDWKGGKAISAMPFSEFKEWVKDPEKTSKPLVQVSTPADSVPETDRNPAEKAPAAVVNDDGRQREVATDVGAASGLPHGSRWKDATPEQREQWLLAAGWKAGSPGTNTLKASEWTALNTRQRAKLAQAMDAQKDEKPAAAEAAPEAPKGPRVIINQLTREQMEAQLNKPAAAPAGAPTEQDQGDAPDSWTEVLYSFSHADVAALYAKMKLGKASDPLEQLQALQVAGEDKVWPVYEAMYEAGELGFDTDEAGDLSESWDYDLSHWPKPKHTRNLPQAKGPFISPDEARARLAEWKAAAKAAGKAQDNSKKVVISLFDASGVISQPWADAGYTVIRYDLEHGDDLFRYPPVGDIQGLLDEGYTVEAVLAQPPCTTFTNSSTRWRAERHDAKAREWVAKMFGPYAAKWFDRPVEYTKALVSIVDLVRDLAKPRWYAMENPVGRIASLMGLPEPVLKFDPHHFGDPYTKRTFLWGDFNPELPLANVEPTDGSKIARMSSSAEKNGGLRSLTSEPFAYALFMAQHQAAQAAAPATEQKAPADPIKTAISIVSEFVAGKIDKPTLIDRLRPLGLQEGQVASVTYRLQDDFSAADIRAVLAKQEAAPTVPVERAKLQPTPREVRQFAADMRAAGLEMDGLDPKRWSMAGDGFEVHAELDEGVAGAIARIYRLEDGEEVSSSATVAKDARKVARELIGDSKPAAAPAPAEEPREAPPEGYTITETADGWQVMRGEFKVVHGINKGNYMEALRQARRDERIQAEMKAQADAPPTPKVEPPAAAADTAPQEATRDSTPATPAPALDRAVAEGNAPEPVSRGAVVDSSVDGRADDRSVRNDGGRGEGTPDENQGVGDGQGDERVPARPHGNVGRGSERVSAGTDYRVPVGGLTREGSWAVTAERNVELIELALKIDKEGRAATPDEQARLAKYVGFGAGEIRNKLFPVPSSYAKQQEPDRLIWPNLIYDAKWKALAERLEALPREWQQSVLQSTQYAHYTSEGVIRSIWSGLQRIGFTGGKVLEPGMGIGSFAMLMPDSVHASSRYTGIEFDGPTALIARLLSPRQNMLHDDFIKRKLPRDYFDLAVGNPPFSQTPIHGDPDYSKHGFMLHDFFFAKSIDRVRPGGLLVFVTSKGTMDKQNDKARKYLAERADLLGAIRLPQTAFEDNAGTKVVTDILFLRKRAAGEQPGGHAWAGVAGVDTQDGTVRVNEYFAAHPDMVLGQQRLSGNRDDEGRRISGLRHDNEYTVVSYDKTAAELEAKIAAAMDRLPANAYSAMAGSSSTLKAETAKVEFDPSIKREGVIYVAKDGTLMRVSEGVGKELAGSVKLSDKDVAWLKGYIDVRDAVQVARRAQFEDGDWQAALKALNKTYDAFRKTHGPINDFRMQTRKGKPDEAELQAAKDEGRDPVIPEVDSRVYKNRRLLREDYDSAIVTQLEHITEAGEIVKARFLKERTIGKPVERTIESAGDALAVSLDELGRLDLEDVARRLKVSEADVIEALGDSVFKAPAGEWQLADEYLSGDVVTKLEEAQFAAREHPELERNVAALKAVQPEKLGPSQISVKLGASWVSDTYVSEFAREIGAGEVRFDPKTETWQVSGANLRSGRSAADEYGTAERSPSELLEAALNSKTVTIKKTYTEDGKKKEATDTDATTAATEKLRAIKEKFKSWVWQDSERAADLVDTYNRLFNNIAPRRFDGSHLSLPGVNLRFTLHKHQRDAIWRQIQTGNTYLAHAVGAGKTLEMIAGGMEQKRLGLIKKPTYVVPNHMLEQFANEFMEAYPLANIMVADDKNFDAERRKAFVAAATLNAPDAIIITQSAFELVGVKEETIRPIVDEILLDLQTELDDTGKGDRVRRSQLQQQIEAVEQRFAKIANTGKKDTSITFEEMGSDFIYADEAHAYRKLDFATNQKIKGIDPNGSQRALDMYVKTRYLERQRPGRSFVFASGTPVTNTMGELYTVMRFFADSELHRLGIASFDSWARAFGEVVPALEANAASKYEVVERFAKFDNVPELMSRVRTFMDVLTSDHLGAAVKRPDVKGGRPNMVLVESSAALKGYMKQVLLPRLEASRKWKPSQQQPSNPDPVIAITGDGRFAALDPRFFGGKLAAGEQSALDVMADRIAEFYHRTADRVFVDRDGNTLSGKGSTQIVFYNLGFGAASMKNRGFNARAALTQRLVKGGVKREQIAWFDDADTDAKKEAIFKDMRSGKLRVLIGSAKKMGTGVNVQNRLGKLHYFDPPWYPSDVEQPLGRIIRQGNLHDEVEIDWYATKGTYQTTMWQMVGRKQRFIDQAFSGDRNVRSMEDVSEASQYEQAAAVASGDPRALQLAGLRQDVERLERLSAAHSQTQINIRAELRGQEWRYQGAENRAQTAESGYKAIGERYLSFGRARAGGQEFDKPGEFGAALKEAFNKVAAERVLAPSDKPIAIGELHGAAIEMHPGTDRKGNLDGTFELTISAGKATFPIVEASAQLGEGVSDVGLSQRLLNALNGLDGKVRQAKAEMAEASQEMKRLRKKLGAPFEHEQDLLAKYAELKQLEDELKAESAAEAKAVPVIADDGSMAGDLAQGWDSVDTNGATVDEVRAAVRELFGDKTDHAVTVVASAAELPDGLRERFSAANGIAVTGRRDDGSAHVFLVAPHMNRETLAGVVMHELGVHYGMKPEDVQQINAQVVRWAAGDGPYAAMAQGAIRNAAQSSSTANRHEEIAAYMVQALVDSGVNPERPPSVLGRLFHAVVAAAKRALSALGLKRELTPQDVVDYAFGAAKVALQRGEPKKPASKAGESFAQDFGAALMDRWGKAKELPILAGYQLGDLFSSAGKVSWWDKTVGTQHHLARRNPLFRRVYEAVQSFIGDVSLYATEAADQAPSILPKLERWGDLRKQPISAEDNKAIARPIFEGTLAYTRDADGRVVRVQDMTTADRARVLVADGHVSPHMMRAWQGLPLEQYEATIATSWSNNVFDGVVWSDAELRSTYNLNDKQIGLYHEFRATVDLSLDNLTAAEAVRLAGADLPRGMDVMGAPDKDAALMDLRNALFEKAEAEPDRADVLNGAANKIATLANKLKRLKAAGYAPLSRFGEYTLHITDPAGNTLFFGMYDTTRERQRAARTVPQQLRDEHPDLQVTLGTVSQQAYKLFAGVSPETLELFGDVLGATDEPLFQQYLQVAKSNRSAMKRLIHRKGIAGFSEDVGRVLAGFVYSNARQTSAALHMGDVDHATRDVTEAHPQGQLADLAVELRDYVKNPQEEAQAVRGLLFAQYLGGSVASALTNATQPFTVTTPYLSQFGGMAKAAARMKRAFDLARLSQEGRLPPELKRALKHAEEEGIVSPQEVHQLMAQAAGRAQLQSGDGTKLGDASARASNAWSKTKLVWGKVFGLAEQWNRRVTFVAAYLTAQEEGISNPAAFAERAVNDTQFVYNKGNKPRWARGALGSVLFTFKQYSISYLELMHRLWTTGGPNGKKAVLWSLAVLFLVGGADGLPFEGDAEDVLDGFLQRLGYNFSSKKAKREFLAETLGLGEGAADFFLKGVSGLPGVPIDVSGRMGMGNLIPGTGLLTKKEDHTSDVAEIAGPLGDLGKRLFQAAGQVVDGDFAKAGETAAPTAIRNIIKGADMLNTGEYRDQSGKKVIDTTPFEAVAKMAGFQPSTVAKVQEATRVVQQQIALNKQRESEIADQWARGVVDAKPELVQQAKDQMRQWNADNPESPIVITMPQIIKRVRKMRETKAERLAATAPKEMRAAVRRELETK